MGDLFAPWRVILLLIVFGFIFLLPQILYILTLQRALRKCAPASRTLEPGLTWLYLIPIVNLIFGFIIVFGMAKTLKNEFNRRGIAVADQTPGQAIGIAMCVCACCGVIPFIGLVAFPAHLALWIIYWTKIAAYSRELDPQPSLAAGPATY